MMIETEQVLNNLRGRKREISEKVIEGQRIDSDEAIYMFREFDVSLLGILAGYVRKRFNGDHVFFNRNIHLEPTNICIHNCLFCSYRRKVNEAGSWEYSLDEIRDFAREQKDKDITEIHVVGGVHPHRDVSYYAKMLRIIREELPSVHIKAFTAVEIDHMVKKSRVSIEEGLRMLIDAGLNSMPGGGAEIFDEGLRKKICPDKTSSEEWLNIHHTAHQLKIPTNATILYGHLENYEQRTDHLRRLRELQDKTGGFNAFIPLKYRNKNNEMSEIKEAGYNEDLKNYAVSRIFLDNIPHIKAYWPMIGKEIAAISLGFGVDDLDGTINDSTRIYTMAGVEEQNPGMSVPEICTLIRNAGRIPVERDSLYNFVKIFA